MIPHYQRACGEPGKFVVATPMRTVCDDNARALEPAGMLRFLALGTRRGTRGVSEACTRLNPVIGLAYTLGGRFLSFTQGEAVRFATHPFFDRWVERQLTPGDHIISSYGYVNRCFQFVRRHGGKTFLDGGNSHPRVFWETISEEHRRWGCGDPPYAEFQHLRALRNMEDVDYVLCPSQWVRSTFLAEGFRPEQLLDNVYPLDVSRFVTDPLPRPKERPLTLISTGSVSLRKGFPYLLEAYDRLWRDDRSIRLLLTDSVSDSMKPVLRKYAHLPIEWAPYLPHDQLTKRLHSADLYLLPSLEEGFARTVAEALGCGLPAIVTERTGSNDIVRTGVNGDVVPIRDAGAIVDAVRRWAPRVMEPTVRSSQLLEPEKLGFPWFAQRFLEQLRKIGLV